MAKAAVETPGDGIVTFLKGAKDAAPESSARGELTTPASSASTGSTPSVTSTLAEGDPQVVTFHVGELLGIRITPWRVG